jgi:amidophosphoribosyltransferase
MAQAMEIPFREGLVKNRYIGRTFIMPNQESRNRSVRRKLNPIGLEFKGKDVLLVDDSIVRGNTSRRIVEMARGAGARKVYFAVTSPPLVAPCPYGIDMASKTEFVAEGLSVQEVAKSLGVDHLVYLDRDAMNAAARAGNKKLKKFCNACFNGEYPTGDITVERLRSIEEERHSHGDKAPSHT